MRTSFRTIAGVVALALIAGCTVKDVEPPSLAGPSTLSRAITLTASKTTLTQNGVDFVDIQVASTSPTGQAQNIPLRAEIFVGGVVQDYGTLSTKTPVTPTTIRYTAPTASTLAAGQVAQTVTIMVTPLDSGDFRNEIARQLDLQLVPQGVILPTNPSLAAAFTVTPVSPKAFQTATFDASTTTNGATACNNLCSYAWNFGDGTSATGMVTTHEFRTIAVFQVTLTVTDSRGAQATKTTAVTVTASDPPTATFTMNPNPAGVNQDVFFTAELSTAVLPRRIVNYGWSFGDGRTASGMTVARSFPLLGAYTIILKVTDDVGAFGTSTQTLTIAEGLPTVSVTVTPTSPKPNVLAVVNVSATPAAGSTITNIYIHYGDATAAENGTNPTRTHTWVSAGTYAMQVTVTDSLGRVRTVPVAVVVAP